MTDIWRQVEQLVVLSGMIKVRLSVWCDVC